MTDKILEQGRSLLDASQPEECVKYLLPEAERLPNEPALLQLLGEAYIETGELQNAYILFLKSSELDSTGEKAGFEKFLWLGQLCGDSEGLEWFETGLEGLRKQLQDQSDEQKRKFLNKKICETLCSMIEIWMTDLCEEEEAEEACEKLITQAMMTDDSIVENWTILGSVRIQQQRIQDAQSALTKGWQLYEETGSGTVEDVPTLVKLCQCMLEVGSLLEVLDATQLIHRIDDHIPDAYYLNGLAHFNLYEQEKEKADGNPRVAARHAVGAKEAFAQLLEPTDEMEVDPDMAANIKEVASSLPEVNDGDYSDSEDEEAAPEGLMDE